MRLKISRPLTRKSLPLLALLALLFATANGITYLSHVLEHAETPLQTCEAASVIQCAMWCMRTTGCIKYSWNKSTGVCQLWPLHSADNPLTIVKEPLYQTILPEGFIISDDPTIAYKQRKFELVGGNDSIIASCKAYDPESFPAFPRTKSQINYIKANVIHPGYLWIGIWDEKKNRAFRDMTTGQLVELPASWWWNNAVASPTGYDCMALFSKGLYSIPCSGTRNGHICQYNIQVNVNAILPSL